MRMVVVLVLHGLKLEELKVGRQKMEESFEERENQKVAVRKESLTLMAAQW